MSTPTGSTVVTAPVYLAEALGLLDDGIRAGSDDWAAARADAVARVTAETPLDDVHVLLDDLATVAGGPHSTFRTPDEVRSWEADALGADGPELPSVERDGDVAVLTLPSFPIDDPAMVEEYVDASLDAIRPLADADVCGWVVDVSLNVGGNAHAMIAAASPLLSDGVVLGLEEPDGTVRELVVDGSTVLSDGDVLAGGTGSPVTIHTPSVAVRHSTMTASAGEAVVVAFYGEPTARTFGSWTRGFTSGNTYTELSDGAGLTVTTGMFQDRLGNTYDGKLAPSIEGPGASVAGDLATSESEWLHSRC
ncbi:S41 family peptidase [Sanguibacter sp. 25GB23B1]|uniref:S41 family peptidase n=1 Tax=unclassified Sanguibacter TaxID=2645534 RepID=UPI0032AFB020